MIDPMRHAESSFSETEKRLTAWGLACRKNNEALGLPTMSGIAQTIAHVQAETKRQKGVRKKSLRAARKAWKAGDHPIDCKEVAEEFGYVEQELTAKGKEKETFIAPRLQLDSNVAQIDFIVGSMQKWAKKCIFRSYLYGQNDRFAADDLRMPCAEYSRRRRAAVEQVAIKIEQRYSACVMPRERRTAREV